MLQTNCIENLIKSESDIIKIADDINQNLHCISKLQDALNLYETMLNIAKIAEGGVVEYKVQLEKIIHFYENILERLRLESNIIANNFREFTKFLENVCTLQKGFNIGFVKQLSEKIIMEISNECIKRSCNVGSKNLQIILLGVGVVGAATYKMIISQQEFMTKNGININIVGIANSKKFITDGEVTVENLRKSGTEYRDILSVIEQIKSSKNLENAVIVDCTASENIANQYVDFIKLGFHIVTPNKQANTMKLEKWKELQEALRKYNKKFLFEANVGAGLPVISTIKDLINAGDEISKIEGILSGTLSYIFNNLSIENPFSKIVKIAQDNGFTEPDPRDDLSGSDVARKLLILARLSGLAIDISDVEVENLVPETLRGNISIADFYVNLAKFDNQMMEMVKNADKNDSVLRYVGKIENGKVSAKIVPINKSNALATTQHTDNIISITSRFYNKSPLVIRGPGAGADVTAVGVFSDIVKLVNCI